MTLRLLVLLAQHARIIHARAGFGVERIAGFGGVEEFGTVRIDMMARSREGKLQRLLEGTTIKGMAACNDRIGGPSAGAFGKPVIRRRNSL